MKEKKARVWRLIVKSISTAVFVICFCWSNFCSEQKPLQAADVSSLSLNTGFLSSGFATFLPAFQRQGPPTQGPRTGSGASEGGQEGGQGSGTSNGNGSTGETGAGPGNTRSDGGVGFFPGRNRRGRKKKKFKDPPEGQMNDPIAGAIGSGALALKNLESEAASAESEKGSEVGERNRSKKDIHDKISAELTRKAEEERIKAEAEKKKKRANEVLGKKRSGKRRFRINSKNERKMSTEDRENMRDRIHEASTSFTVLIRLFALTLIAVLIGAVGFVGKTFWDKNRNAAERIQRQKRYQRKW